MMKTNGSHRKGSGNFNGCRMRQSLKLPDPFLLTFHLTDAVGNNERKGKKEKKKLCYTGGDGETAIPACCVSMDKKLYILYLWGW